MTTLSDWKKWEEREEALRLLPKKICTLLAATWTESVLPIFEKKCPENCKPRAVINLVFAGILHNNLIEIKFDPRDHYYNVIYNSLLIILNTVRNNYSIMDYAYNDYAITTCSIADQVSMVNSSSNEIWTWSYNLYKHALGYGTFHSHWKTSTVIQLVNQIVENRDCTIFPILADALQDADCDNNELLKHLREDKNEWALSDSVIWNVLGI